MYLLKIKVEYPLQIIVGGHNIEADRREVPLCLTDQEARIIHQVSYSLE